MERMREHCEVNPTPSELFFSQKGRDSKIQTSLGEIPPILQIKSSPCDMSNTSELLNSGESSTPQQNITIPSKPEYTHTLTSMFESEDFENGIVNLSENYFAKILQEDSLSAMNGLATIFWNNFSNDGRKIKNLIGILHTVSHFQYSVVYPIGQVLALSALNHKNNEVCEFAIKCFENWEDSDAIEQLKATHFSAKWLQDYAEQVVKELGGDV
ncbi:MAG: hypothetical protein RR053_06765 [Evtepia sp.]